MKQTIDGTMLEASTVWMALALAVAWTSAVSQWDALVEAARYPADQAVSR
jgi:hypothetical protein